MNADPDPDPATPINADPCGSGSGSETLLESDEYINHSSSNVMLLDKMYIFSGHLENEKKILMFAIIVVVLNSDVPES